MEQQQAHTFILRLIPALLWMLVIFLLSMQSTIPTTPSLPASLTAIAGHLVAYATLAILIAVALRGVVRPFGHRAAIAFVVSTLYGVSDEFHQSFVPGRHADIFDVIIDAIGAAIGLWFLYIFLKFLQQRRETA